ncbi:CheW domain-containing protein, partial [Oleiphilus sp. HI0123]
ILEKKKSKLSAAQLSRLEAKLGLKAEPELKTKVKQEVLVETVDKPKVSVSAPAPLSDTKVDAKVQAREAVTTEVSEIEKIHEKRTALVTPGEPGQVGPPSWAQDRFECLIFSVAGLKLAVPLVSLGAIYKIEKELTPIVGRADYFMGLYRHLDRNVRVVDTAQWVMPDRWSEDARAGYQFIIRLGGNNWGLACDSVHESIQLEPDMVKWRSERTSRAWLSGTVIGHMCALLDADVMSLMLEEKASGNGSSIS